MASSKRISLPIMAKSRVVFLMETHYVLLKIKSSAVPSQASNCPMFTGMRPEQEFLECTSTGWMCHDVCMACLSLTLSFPANKDLAQNIYQNIPIKLSVKTESICEYTV